MIVLQRKFNNMLTKADNKVIYTRKSFLKEAKESAPDLALTSQLQSKTPSKRKSSKLYQKLEKWIH